MSDNDDLIDDLAQALRDTIGTYMTGHDIPVATVVGVLSCLANEVIFDNDSFFIIDEDEQEDF